MNNPPDAAPNILPIVFQPYIFPVYVSSFAALHNPDVINGSVIPAKKLAGHIMSMQRIYLRAETKKKEYFGDLSTLKT
jgi:hypothetical protein